MSRCFQAKHPSKPEDIKDEACSNSKKLDQKATVRYCGRITYLEGNSKGKQIYDCFAESDVKGEFNFSKTIQETLTCENITSQSYKKGEVEFCACSSDLCNGGLSSKVNRES